MRLFYLISLFGVLIISGCGSVEEDSGGANGNEAITALDCAQISAYADGNITCIAVSPDTVLLQLPENTQLTLRTDGINVTFDSTLYWSAQPGGQMTLATLEGVSVVGVSGVTRIIHAGGQITLPLDDGQLSSSAIPAMPQPYDYYAILQTPLHTLPRPVSFLSPIAPVVQVTAVSPTPFPMDTATPAIEVTAECVPREDWRYFYTIRRGDTLTRIANLHDVAVTELQEGNCITNPNRISLGEVLRVPSESEYTRPITVTPGAVFYADSNTLQAGECTTLQWEVAGAGVVYYEGSPVAQSASRQVCPTTTTTYTLRVAFLSGEQVDYTVVITVEGQ